MKSVVCGTYLRTLPLTTFVKYFVSAQNGFDFFTIHKLSSWKKFPQSQDSNPLLLGKKQKGYLCAVVPPPPNIIIVLVCCYLKQSTAWKFWRTDVRPNFLFIFSVRRPIVTLFGAIFESSPCVICYWWDCCEAGHSNLIFHDSGWPWLFCRPLSRRRQNRLKDI